MGQNFADLSSYTEQDVKPELIAMIRAYLEK